MSIKQPIRNQTKQIKWSEFLMKNRFILLLTTCLLLLSQVANADFRKALDAYIARDGDTLLKKVKDAVEKKNDDGLMLFLMATNFDAATSDYDPKTKKLKSTLQTILSKRQFEEMHALLRKVANNTSVDARYYLEMHSQFSPFIHKLNHIHIQKAFQETKEKYAEAGSYEAVQMMNFTAVHPRNGESMESFLKRSEHWLIQYASLGDALAQLKLGLQYHNYVGNFGCDLNKNGPICRAGENKDKGDYWLKKAIKSFLVSGRDHFQIMIDIMCDFTRSTAGNNKALQQESERWCSIPYSLNKQEIDFGNSEIPSLLRESWVAVMADNPPIITVDFAVIKPEYSLDVYSDGSVFVAFNSNMPTYKEKLLTLSESELKVFLNELDQIFKEKRLQQSSTIGTGRYGEDGLTVRMTVVVRRSDSLRRLYVEHPNAKTINQNDVWTTQLAKLKYIIEKNIELKALVNEIGNSQSKKDSRIKRDTEWALIAKENLEE